MTTDTKQTFTCPWSGTQVAVSIPPQKSADEFCPTCDFPMFWAYKVDAATREAARLAEEADAEAAAPTESADADVAGVTVACPQCGTANPDTAQYCSQCGTSLHPPEPEDTGWNWKAVLALLVVVFIAAIALAILYWPF